MFEAKIKIDESYENYTPPVVETEPKKELTMEAKIEFDASYDNYTPPENN